MTKIFSAGEKLLASELNTELANREPIGAGYSKGFLTGGATPSTVGTFQTLRSGANDGKLKFQIDQVVFDNVPVNLIEGAGADTMKFGELAAYSANSAYYAQSFIVASETFCSKLAVDMQASTGIVTLTLRLGTQSLGGTILGVATANVTASGFADFIFDSPIKLSVGQGYTFVMSAATNVVNCMSTTTGFAGYQGAWQVNYDIRFRLYEPTFIFSSTYAQLATLLQTTIRRATGGSEVVAYVTDHFVVTSGIYGDKSQVLKFMTPTAGVDLSGVNATRYFDLGTNATETAGAGHTDNQKGVLVGGSAPSAISVFQTLGDGSDDGKVKFNIDGVVYDNVAVPVASPGFEIAEISIGTGTGTTTSIVNAYYGAQTFTIPAGMKFLTKLSILGASGGTGTQCYIDLKKGSDPNTATAINTYTYTGASNIGWLTVTLPTPLEVIAGEVYTVYARPIGRVEWQRSNVDGYAGGQGYYNNGGGTYSTVGVDHYAIVYGSANVSPQKYTNIATNLQTAIRAITGKAETVAWDGNKFIVRSSTGGKDSKVLKFMTPTTGTDISGVGGTKYLDLGTTAQGEFTGLNDYNKIPKIDANGFLSGSVIPINATDFSSKNGSTVYTAEADGFVLATAQGGYDMNGYADYGVGNTLRIRGYASGTSQNLVMPVKKGMKWQVTVAAGSLTLWWVPFGN